MNTLYEECTTAGWDKDQAVAAGVADLEE